MNKFSFSTINVAKQVFYQAADSFAIVNLKPLVPGHVLVVPKRVVPRLADLESAEVASLFKSVQTVGRVVEREYGADGLTIACQDGKAAGQTVPHVHIHVLPRKSATRPDGGDAFSSNNDSIYPALEKSERKLAGELAPTHVSSHNSASENIATDVGGDLKMDVDDRKPRSLEEMEREATWLKQFFVHDNVI